MCQWSVQFVLKHERHDATSHEHNPRLRFASLQSETARRLLEPLGHDPATLSTLTVLDRGRVSIRSDAVLSVAGHLKRPWRWVRLTRIIPRPLRDVAYKIIASNRYRLFGRAEECLVPTTEQQARFLTDDTDTLTRRSLDETT